MKLSNSSQSHNSLVVNLEINLTNLHHHTLQFMHMWMCLCIINAKLTKTTTTHEEKEEEEEEEDIVTSYNKEKEETLRVTSTLSYNENGWHEMEHLLK